jgi:hypothetical protein
MADTDPAIIGIQSCGCITYANSRPDRLHRDDERELADIIRNGGSIDRTTVGEARQRPFFMAYPCPHDPPGWTAQPECDDCKGTGELTDGVSPCPTCAGSGWAVDRAA